MITQIQAPMHAQLKKIVVGMRGCVIGEIGITARKELITLLKRNVHLILPVKVSERKAASL